jgi:hypothetical protein
MNIIEKVNNREITPRHNNYQEVTVDAKGNGPIINFSGVHTRASGLAGLSPLKQTWLDNVQKGLGAAGWVPGWGAIADLGNAAISGGRSLYSLATGDMKGAKKHGENVLWNVGYAIPGLEYGVKGAKVGNKIYKNLRTTGNPVQSFKKNPKRSIAETGIGGLVESQTSYEPGSGYNPEMFDGDDIKRFNEGLSKEFGKVDLSGLNQSFNDNIKKPIQDKVESYNIDGKDVNKQEFDDYSNKMKNKGSKPNKSWEASDYQKYYDNMKKQKN